MSIFFNIVYRFISTIRFVLVDRKHLLCLNFSVEAVAEADERDKMCNTNPDNPRIDLVRGDISRLMSTKKHLS